MINREVSEVAKYILPARREAALELADNCARESRR